MKKKAEQRVCLIWSIEHNSWWRPNHAGYTEKREEAGRYTFTEALAVLKSANIRNDDTPNEAIVVI